MTKEKWDCKWNLSSLQQRKAGISILKMIVSLYTNNAKEIYILKEK